MEAPFQLDERTRLQPATVSMSSKDPCKFRITIIEGKNRQIRRVCDRLGYRILSLCRISIGDIDLEGLKEGSVCHLTDRERNSIISIMEH
jgi:pseudouridine synthase